MANTNTQTKNFIVLREGKVDRELSTIYRPPTVVEKAKGYLSLQSEMALYDILHRTSYRRTYNRILREQKNRAFEARLGLERVRTAKSPR